MDDANPGTARLAKVLSGRVQEAQRRNIKVMVDYGEVDGAYNLTTNNFPRKIPPKDYMVCYHLTELIMETDAADSRGDTHRHKYKTRYLQPGDRVLVVRIGNEFCIVDVIRPGTVLQAEEVL